MALLKKKSRLKAAFYVTVLCVLVFFLGNVYHQLSLLSGMGSDNNNNGVVATSTSRSTDSQERRKQQWIQLVQMRRQPSWESMHNDGAFIHIGKTGGSSISLLLRNGCHSFMPKPCRTVPLETIVSKLVGTYYHGTWQAFGRKIYHLSSSCYLSLTVPSISFFFIKVPDFGLIPQAKHTFYIISLRDPLARSISAFTYEHIDNVKARGETMTPLEEEFKSEAIKCFPTLETFVDYIGDDPGSYDYDYHQSQIVSSNCTNLARAVIDGKVRKFKHLFFSLEKIRSFIPGDNPFIFVTRQEHLWYDWKKINFLLGQASDMLIPGDDSNARDLSKMNQPVTRELSDIGKERLCKALKDEYDSYIKILQEAINLSDSDVEETLNEIKAACPNIVAPTIR